MSTEKPDLLRTSWRKRIITPDKVLPVVTAALDELGQLFDAIGERFGDDRWKNASVRIGCAVSELRKRSPAEEVLYRTIRAHEEQEQLEAAKIIRAPSRKPMARIPPWRRNR